MAFAFEWTSNAAWSVQRSRSVSLSGLTTLWKTSNCSQPGSFMMSMQRALYSFASSEPFPGAAVIATIKSNCHSCLLRAPESASDNLLIKMNYRSVARRVSRRLKLPID